jgi:hypothetical protein
MTRQQLEMRLDGAITRRQPMRFRRRTSRARWWFDQMRLAVDQAPDVQTTPPDAQTQASH